MENGLKRYNVEDDQIQNILFRLSIICCTGIAIATIYDRSDIASRLFYASFFINFAAFIDCIHWKLVDKTIRFIMQVLLFIVIFGIVSIISVDITFNYTKK
ncbi:MAG: hypothetical protein IKR46_04035, partial [Clostridia bacterium]|nr:hypothetical protein [Clostridia bacterium]